MTRTKENDEKYIIDLIDVILQSKARRQHKFDFLVGDPGKNGKRRKLPVDAFYPEHNLVVEYKEKQHTETVPFFDKKNRFFSECSDSLIC